MTFLKLMYLKKSLPNLNEINLSENLCNDFENIRIEEEEFSKLKSIDLSNNQIISSEGLALLNRFPAIENINLAYNTLTEIKGLIEIKNLKSLNLRGNLLQSHEFIKNLVKLPTCESLRITENPILETKDPVHIKYLCIASLDKIKIFNGSEQKKYEIKDCRIYYWRNSFHEFFLKHNTTHQKYIFSEYLVEARKLYPKIEHYLRIYDLPYDAPHQPHYKELIGKSDSELQIETQKVHDKLKNKKSCTKKQVFPEDKIPTMKLNKVTYKNGIEILVTKKNKKRETMFIKIKFVYNNKLIPKKIPKRVDFSFVINFVKAQFKLSNKKGINLVWMKNHENQVEDTEKIPIDNLKTKIKDLISGDNARIEIFYNEEAE